MATLNSQVLFLLSTASNIGNKACKTTDVVDDLILIVNGEDSTVFSLHLFTLPRYPLLFSRKPWSMVSEHMLIYFALLALYIIDKVLPPHSIQSLPRCNMLRCFSCYLFDSPR